MIKKRQQRLKWIFLGVQFNNVTMLDMIEHVKTFFTQTEDNLFIVTANPEIVDYASEHSTYVKQLINSAECSRMAQVLLKHQIVWEHR